jgi:hypothetical protein
VSVEAVLDKIAKHNDSVLGCLVMAQDKTYHNLPDVYSMVDFNGVTEYAQSMFDVTDSLEGDGLDQIFLEFQNHSIYARRVDESVLVLVNKPIPRTVFKKMQVGVNLFVKPLQRALTEPQNDQKASDDAAAAAEPAQKTRKKGIGITRMYRGIKY